MNEIVKKSRKPSANVELEMPLASALKKAAEAMDLPQAVVRQALLHWAWDQIAEALQNDGSEIRQATGVGRSYEQAIKDVTLAHLTRKAQAGRTGAAQ